jgi:hypothetical protein
MTASIDCEAKFQTYGKVIVRTIVTDTTYLQILDAKDISKK